MDKGRWAIRGDDNDPLSTKCFSIVREEVCKAKKILITGNYTEVYLHNLPAS